MLRTCSSCKQVWIIKFSIIKKRNIYERVGVTNFANLTRDVETKIHRFESHRGKHSKKDYLTSLCLKLKILSFIRTPLSPQVQFTSLLA